MDQSRRRRKVEQEVKDSGYDETWKNNRLASLATTSIGVACG